MPSLQHTMVDLLDSIPKLRSDKETTSIPDQDISAMLQTNDPWLLSHLHVEGIICLKGGTSMKLSVLKQTPQDASCWYVDNFFDAISAQNINFSYFASDMTIKHHIFITMPWMANCWKHA